MKPIAIPISGALRARMERVIRLIERGRPGARVVRTALVQRAVERELDRMEKDQTS